MEKKLEVNSNLKNSFLFLIRLGIGHPVMLNRFNGIDWKAIEALAMQQGLSAIIVDSIDKLPENQRPPKILLLQWIGEVLQNQEQRYELYCKAIAEMAGWHSGHDYKMMLLKGYACGMNWPKPEHRPYGDIDIWQFGKQKEADAVIAKEKGIKVDKSHHHHTVFVWRDFIVENHYDFVNVHAHKSSKELEKVFKELGQDDSHSIELCGEKVFLPSPNLHALFLLRHMVSHFASTNINLRQVLDWAFFVKAHDKEVDWKWLESLLERYHMKDFFNCINAICVEDIGFPVETFKTVQFEPQLKDRVLNDILFPVYTAKEPHELIKRQVYRFRRWQGNAWKQGLCYNESRWSAFGTGIWAKLLKPASI